MKPTTIPTPTLALILLLPTYLTALSLPSNNNNNLLHLPRDTKPPTCCTEALNAQAISDATAYNNAITACAARGCTSTGSSAASAAEVNDTAGSGSSTSSESNKWQEKWVTGCSDCEGVEAPYSCYCSPCRYLPDGCV